MRGINEIDPGDSYFDSRDLIARLEYLTDERDALQEAVDTAKIELSEAEQAAQDTTATNPLLDTLDLLDALRGAENDMAAWLADNATELEMLTQACREGENDIGDWSHGVGLIHEDAFEGHAREHARELAEDIGVTKYSDTWPFTCIDWAEAAKELQQDYTPVEIGGHTYYARG